jgi:Protein of unknown function (DUF1579)
MTEGAHSGTFEHEAPEPGPEYARLEVFIGKWINEGETVAKPDAPGSKIVTSDVYEWIPGRFAVLHTAYGRLRDLDVGGVEILGYDAESGEYTSHFFDSQGHVTVDELIHDDGKWIWRGERIARPPSSAMTERFSALFTSNQKTGSIGSWRWM